MGRTSQASGTARVFLCAGFTFLFICGFVSCSPDSPSSKNLSQTTIDALTKAFSSATEGYGKDPKLILFDNVYSKSKSKSPAVPGIILIANFYLSPKLI